MRGFRRSRLRASPRFNGAAFFQSGKSLGVTTIAPIFRASMEPLFFKAENVTHDQPYGLLDCTGASMEPLFFKAENKTWLWQSTSCPIRLQWSRFFSKRKMATSLSCRCTTAKGLQWSRFFSKRKIPLFDLENIEVLAASMEPLFFKAENRRRRPRHGSGSGASMEPLFFKAENV